MKRTLNSQFIGVSVCSMLAVTALQTNLKLFAARSPGVPTGTHLNVALADQTSARRAFVATVVRSFGQRLSDGIDVWPERPVYDLVSVALPHSKWDVLETTADIYARGKRDGLFEPIMSAHAPVGSRRNQSGPVYGVPAGYVATAMVFSTAAYAAAPRDWTALWNFHQYPGGRALRDSPEGTLELALLSDGVAAGSLYPLDVDRALRRLQQLRPHIALWWSDEGEVLRAVSAGTVTMAAVPSSFLYAAESARSGLSVADSGSLLESRWWVIPKGHAGVPEAREFIRYVADGTTPLSHGMYGIASPSTDVRLNTEVAKARLKNGGGSAHWPLVAVNSAWWDEHRDAVEKRWNEWRTLNERNAK